MPLRIALATCRDYRDLPIDERLLMNALRTRGHRVDAAIWDDASVKWSEYDCCVVRSTWDFHHKYRDFEKWIARLTKQTVLVNDGALMRWNMRKRYLLDIASRGIPIVPTILIPATIDMTDPRLIAQERGWPQFVLKPEISASSFKTAVFDLKDDAQPLLRSIHQDSDALLQPFVPDVNDGGEKSYIFIDGEPTHVIRRAPFNGGAKGVSQPLVDSRSDEAELARRTMLSLPNRPTYARVDIVRLPNDKPVIAELEMIEPALFLEAYLPSVEIFATAILRAIP